MSKPLYFLVWVDGVEHRKETRKAARLFAAFHKAMGKKVIVKGIGF